jgi:hypothetical protein
MVELNPAKDNTLIQRIDPAAQSSNGQGDIFVGRTNQDGQGTPANSIRRGLVYFDVASSVPTGSLITGVSLTVRDVMGLNGDPTVTLHRLLQDWGEGSSFQNGGMGAAATNGDTTWLYTSFVASDPSSSPHWTTPGGSFSSTFSGSSVISDDLGSGQLFSWSSANDPQLLSDVQLWLDSPDLNFGWILIGDETRGQSVKRLNSSESANPPILRIEYTAVPEASTLVLAGLGAVGVGLIRIRRRSI